MNYEDKIEVTYTRLDCEKCCFLERQLAASKWTIEQLDRERVSYVPSEYMLHEALLFFRSTQDLDAHRKEEH